MPSKNNLKGEVSLISVDYTVEALGIRNLSGVLRKEGFSTKLIILPKNPCLSYENTYSSESLEAVYELVKNSSLIGISTMSYSRDLAIQLTNYLKKSSVPIVWGGIHPTIKPEECLEHVDAICIGEGERVIVELAGRVSEGLPFNDVSGLWTKADGQLYKNDVPRLIDQLDTLPYPDFDFVNEFVLNQQTDKVERVDPGSPRVSLANISVVLARGCPHTCTYCYNSVFKNIYKGKGRWLRFNSIEYCIGLLKYFKSRFPQAKNFQIVDDNFLARPEKEIEKFADEYKSKVGLPFSVFCSPKTFDEGKLKILIDAGMNKITIGIQSGSDYINKDIYRREQDNSALIEMAKLVNKYKRHVFVRYDFLALNPYEKEKDVIKTISLMRALPKPYYASLNELDFYPGSELTKRALADGLINKGTKSSTFNIVIEEGLMRLRGDYKDDESRYINLIYALTKGLHSRFIYGVVPSLFLAFLVHPMMLRVVHMMPKKILNKIIDIVLTLFTHKYLLRNLYRIVVRARGKVLELKIDFFRRVQHIGP